LKSGAIVKADLQAALELLRALVGAVSPQETKTNHWLELARELWRVMQKA
jgi:hypothetical protein